MEAATQSEYLKDCVARYALKFLDGHTIIGLGSGSTAARFVRELGRAPGAARYRCACTSHATLALAKQVGLTVIPDEQVERIEITIDGADEVTPEKTMIKGGGGAMMRERIAAANSDFHVTIVDYTKLHDRLGDFPLPIEIAPDGSQMIMNKIRETLDGLGCELEAMQLRQLANGTPYVTDNGNHICDAKLRVINEPVTLGTALKSILGVLDHGLFVGLTNIICVAKQNGDIFEIR